MDRVRHVKSRRVIIDKKECPKTWTNFQEAAYDQNSRLPKLEKRTDQHGLDGVLHAMHAGEGVLSIPAHLKKKYKQSGIMGDRYGTF